MTPEANRFFDDGNKVSGYADRAGATAQQAGRGSRHFDPPKQARLQSGTWLARLLDNTTENRRGEQGPFAQLQRCLCYPAVRVVLDRGNQRFPIRHTAPVKNVLDSCGRKFLMNEMPVFPVGSPGSLPTGGVSPPARASRHVSIPPCASCATVEPSARNALMQVSRSRTDSPRPEMPAGNPRCR